MLAYGQTGSGKTHTITGILERIGSDLFDLRGHGEKDENGESYLKLHLTSFELLSEARRKPLQRSLAHAVNRAASAWQGLVRVDSGM